MGDAIAVSAVIAVVALTIVVLLQGLAAWWVFNARMTYSWIEQHGGRGFFTCLLCYLAWPALQHVADQVVAVNKGEQDA